MTEHRKRLLKRKLQESRYRLYNIDADFALPLKEMTFVATKDVRRISTNGKCICFDPDWLQKLGKTEIDFMLSHQLMHIVLGHIDRPKYYKGERFHLACDIVANSNLELFGWKYEKLPNVGTIYCETFFPEKRGRSMTAQEAFECIPFDPALKGNGVRRSYMIDSEIWWDRKDDNGENGVVVLSPKDEDPEDLIYDVTIGGNRIFLKKESFEKMEIKIVEMEESEGDQKALGIEGGKEASPKLAQLRREKIKRDSQNGEEDFVERVWRKACDGKLEWRKLLSSFIQEEVCDYSFLPPDRRLSDSEFFLPDYNVLMETPKKVLFMVDTSGSIDDEDLVEVYGELCNAINQFNGALVGMLGFFDSRVYAPKEFTDGQELLKIKPVGGGGTSFRGIFKYIEENMANERLADIVIFTDGEAEFPDVTTVGNIPVLWLLSNKTIIPPWGAYAYVENTEIKLAPVFKT